MFARLNALAVFAFSAAIARLPSHWSSGLLPLNATAQTNPWRFTTAAHSLLSKPPLLGPPAALTLFLRMSASLSWSIGHAGFGFAAGPAGVWACNRGCKNCTAASAAKAAIEARLSIMTSVGPQSQSQSALERCGSETARRLQCSALHGSG